MPARPEASELVAVAGLAGGYGRRTVLRDVAFTARAGERIGVLGPNGGGKTTLFRLLTGELERIDGEVHVQRTAVVGQTERSRLDFPVSATDVAAMGAIARLPWWRRPGRAERRAAREALERVGLAEHAGETFGALSGGQRQRVLVARALVQDAPVLLLDEPFTGLDGVSAERLERLLDQLAAEGRALLVATHDVVQARRWDRVLCVNGTLIAEGPPDVVLDRATLEATYGSEVVPLDGGRAVVGHHHCG